MLLPGRNTAAAGGLGPWRFKVANLAKRVPQDVAGDFFVDTTCIDCDTCRQLAPAVFGEAAETAFVQAQPETARRAAAGAAGAGLVSDRLDRLPGRGRSENGLRRFSAAARGAGLTTADSIRRNRMAATAISSRIRRGIG